MFATQDIDSLVIASQASLFPPRENAEIAPAENQSLAGELVRFVRYIALGSFPGAPNMRVT
jgi:hypothetical protein